MTITEAQHKVDEWIKKYGVKYFKELTNLGFNRVINTDMTMFYKISISFNTITFLKS